MMIPRIMIAAAQSGSGKTTITCGILKVLCELGMKTVSCKCGPDYIDPMFHEKVLNTPSKNLDTFFTDKEVTKELFFDFAKDADIAVVEGVMGYYDGLGGISVRASSYELATYLKLPVILVINAKGMSNTVSALIKGIKEYKKDSNIKAVILNQMSPMLLKDLKAIIEMECNVEVLGCIPTVKAIAIESRHLGLMTPDRISDIQDKINNIADIISKNINIERIIEIAKEAEELETVKTISLPRLSKKINLAIAKDNAFCFYYRDNLEMLEKMGINIIEFSPLKDDSIPDNCNAILFGGGYPESYTKDLSKNTKMLKSISENYAKGTFIMAECGGFMYLHEEMESEDGEFYKMAGIIKGKSYKTSKLQRFGYIELEPFNKIDTKDRYKDILSEEIKEGFDEKIKAHEFHYWDSDDCGSSFIARKPLRNREWECMHFNKGILAGFPHLYYYSNPQFIYNIFKKIGDEIK